MSTFTQMLIGNRFSIHAPRGGSDLLLLQRSRLRHLFQSTLPVGGATYSREWANRMCIISIHAPRGGSDASGDLTPNRPSNFNPRSPWGERRLMASTGLVGIPISIHAPRGGSDRLFHQRIACPAISIHAPRGGSDSKNTQIDLCIFENNAAKFV